MNFWFWIMWADIGVFLLAVVLMAHGAKNDKKSVILRIAAYGVIGFMFITTLAIGVNK